MHDFNMTDALGLKLVHVVAGAIGGLVRSIAKPEQSLRRHVALMVIGAACAGYLAPVVSPILMRVFDLDPASISSLDGTVGFLVGTSGLRIAEWLIDFAQSRVGRAG